ncbi:T9SS type A sorting domain-containing protein [Dyadobacter sp. CY107]|uniref:T9SS type A sorting domain-containing protein n=1 Tax=Dyadobacter fanqingshengii TaxID=2906443 RepID=UPI001F1C5E50|nr:T9SS type A sorting domain-containing protein [Dyadobacter fanqingshengii]MCF2505393.1 T9SS type A sorting domain-containing protein [Dyadobacter fanqingshengii]
MKGIFTAMLFLFCVKTMAQCPSTGLVLLYEQSDVDNYFANGGCAVVEHLIIGDGRPNITNLNGLNGITTVTGVMQVNWLPIPDFTGLETLTSIGNLSIEWSPLLKNFKGLENLETINSLAIFNMENLEDFTGLESVTITGDIGIGGCPALKTITSLSVTEALPNGLMIGGCPLLENISSFSNLKSTTRLWLASCPSIENMQWLSSLEAATDIRIESNAQLSSLSGLENLNTTESLWIIDNKNLSNLTGLEALQTAETIEINYNNKLNNLDGLETLKAVKSITIRDNPLLASIGALGNISSKLNYVSIFSNEQLSNCTVDFLCSMIFNPSPGNWFFISANQGACSDKTQLTLACKEAMPVTLLSFEAVLEKQFVNLIWKTSEEYNSEKFEVHHSINGKDWLVIGELKSSGVGGLGSGYQFTHQTPTAGNNYYRLKMIDFDQTYALSTISHVYFNRNVETIYPNPTSDAIHVSSLNPGQIESFELVNSKGSVVMKRRGGKTDIIDLDKYPAGSYILRVVKKDSGVSSHKVVVSK